MADKVVRRSVFTLLLFVNTLDAACLTGRRDIALVIDESGSVMHVNFVKQLAFLQKVASAFSIGEQGTLFGAVAFNTHARLAFTLDQYKTKDSLLTAIGSVSYVPGGTSIGAGIDFVRQNVFSVANGDRTGVDDYIIVITDGFSADTVTSGIAARNAGFTLFAVGVDGYDLNDLIAATGDVSKVFTAPNYDSLDGIVDQLTNAFPCDFFCGDQVIGNGPPVNPVTNKDTAAGLDVYLDVTHIYMAGVVDEVEAAYSSGTPGLAYLLTDEMYISSCCGVVEAVEFVPSVSGTFEFLVWRPNGSGGNTYRLIGKSDVIISDSQVWTLVNYTFPVGGRLTFTDGDTFGWYSTGAVIPAYALCVDAKLCPGSYVRSVVTSLEPGMASVWGGAGISAVTGRVYDFRIHTANNTAPSPPQQTTALIPDHLAVGDVVMTYAPVDADKAETFTHVLNHPYFYYDTSTDEIKVKSLLPRSYAEHSMSVISTDSCQHSLTTTVVITTYNSPPVIENLPTVIFITDNITAGDTIFHLDLVDKSNDSLCCHISGVNPQSANFLLNVTDDNPRVMIANNSRFDNRLISNHYKLTICCSDGIIATQNYLEVSVKAASRKAAYVPPGWFTMAVTMSMLPISTLILSACIIMGVTCMCDKKGHVTIKSSKTETDT